MDFFVFPHCKGSESELMQLTNCGRLYAYPAIPKKQDCQITILDSGAYGLSQAGRTMGIKYLKNLSEHYERYYNDHTICVAPDVVCNPMATIQNFKKWHDLKLFKNISPVIQPADKKSIDFELYKYQIDFYTKKYDIKIMLFSNWLSADLAIAQGVQKSVDYARSQGVTYIHMLGAGWNLSDVKKWNSIRGINSCDSIAYYTEGAVHRFGSQNPAENARRIICEINRGRLRIMR